MIVTTRKACLAVALSALAFGAGAGAAAGAEPLPQPGDPVTLDPAQFGGPIDNPWMPLAPGSRWVYREIDEEGLEHRVDVTVLDTTRTILGIEATIVHDVASLDGVVEEDTFDWYAQDANGDVWYLGEATTEYEDGVPSSTAGSWEAGVAGAQPGIVALADPAVGDTYSQEYLEGEAEDAAGVLSLDEWAQVPFGTFRDVLLTREFTPLTPDVLEYKLYARGVGQVLALGVSGGASREELVEFVPAP